MSFNFNNHQYKVFTWNDVKNPKAVVQLIHGAHEYLERYDEFAKYLNSNGFICLGIEHLGHGSNATGAEYVSFDNENGENVVLDAQVEFSKYIKENYELPLVVFGHSMGSFILRSILPEVSQLANAVVISGTTYVNRFQGKSILYLAKLLRAFKGPDNYSKLLFDLTMGGLVKKMLKNKEINNGYEWLTTDERMYQTIAEDKYLHKKFTIGGNHDMITWINKANSSKVAMRVKKEIPIYLMSGEKDPMNLGVVKKVNDLYQKNGIENITFVEYDGRHEMLNEVIREIVYQDICQFYSEYI